MNLDKICRAFKRNRFDCTIFETAEEAAAYLSQEIQELMLCTIRCEMIFITRKQNGQKAAD